MSCELVPGNRDWSLDRDAEGHRTYKIVHLVRGDRTDGPYVALNCPGLPLPGSIWNFFGDYDPWAWCSPAASVKRAPGVREYGPGEYFHVEQTFSTKPNKKCQDNSIEDPLLEPQKISGDFTRVAEEASFDRDGYPILNSAHEVIRGPQVEWEKSKPVVKIEQNVASLGLEVFVPMADTLNDAPLWGLPARFWKFTPGGWSQKFFGTCSVYYTRSLVFEAWSVPDPDTGDPVSGWDRILLDEGSKALNGENINGHWVVKNFADDSEPDSDNPSHFVRYKDKNGDNARCILNGFGLPIDLADTGTSNDEPGRIFVEKLPESNFLLLGIPLTL